MPDIEDDEFAKAFEGFGEDDSENKLPEEVAPAPAVDAPEDKKTEENKEAKGTEEGGDADSKADDKKAEEEVQAPAPPTPAAESNNQPLTKDDVTAIISNLRNEERNSGKELETTTQEVIQKYYPDGLTNVLVDEKSGKELRVPADVVEASGGQMSTEDAAQWLLNEQFKLDKQVASIKDQARQIAETTVNFRRDAMAAVQKYEPLFKAYPHLQQKVYDKLMKQVKVDDAKGVVLASPDVMEHYDDYLEPYQQAFEFSTNKPATNPVAPEVPAPAPEPPKPSAEDRMDISGDGGQAPVDDPNDFAQQVTKELAK